MRRLILILIPFCFLAILACQKETSFETGNPAGFAEGTIQKDSFDNCMPVTTSGTFREGTALNDSNYVTIQLNITTPGQYRVFGDTANGVWFSDSGFVGSSGTHTVKIRARGTPILGVPTTFSVYFGASACDFEVDIEPALPSGNLNDADTAWMFNEGSKHLHGSIDSAKVELVNGVNYLVLKGRTTNATPDSIFRLIITMPGNTVSTGSYSSSLGTANFGFTTGSGNPIYLSYQGNNTNLVVNITAYDAVTKIMDANFSGTAKDFLQMTTYNITAGKLKLQVE